jgi:hypothetical protein
MKAQSATNQEDNLVLSTRHLLETLGEKDQGSDEIKLTAEAANVIEECEKIMNDKRLTHSQKLAKSIPLLAPFAGKPIEILKMSAASHTVDRIFHHQSQLTSGMGDALAKKGLPGGTAFNLESSQGTGRKFTHGAPIASVDGGKKIHVVDQIVAASIFTKYQKSSDRNPELLNYACDNGSYPALRARCDETRARLKEAIDKQAYPNINADFDKLNADLKSLANLYWTVGYMDASKIWLDLAITYANKTATPTMENADPETTLWIKTFAEAAAENIYCAKILSANETSQAIIQDLCGASHTTLQEVYQVKDWDAGVDQALAPLKLPAAAVIDLKGQLEKNAKERITQLQTKPEMKMR